MSRRPRERGAVREEASFKAPIKVLEVATENGIPTLDGCLGYRSIRVLVRRAGRPMGWASIRHDASDSVPSARVVDAVQEQIVLEEGRGMRDELKTSPGGLSLPALSVVIATKDRPWELRRCLEALTGSRYPSFEVIVVDNGSTTPEPAAVAADFPVRYVREDRTGWGRNRGIAEAAHDVIVFTDDDVRPDPCWLDAVGKAFTDPGLAMLTGLVVPTELETPAQVLFELACGGMGKGFRSRRFHRDEMTLAQRVRVQSLGVGANMAFRRTVFESVGMFDPALGPGTAASAGEDLEIFHRVIEAGFQARYEPMALVWHRHRETMPALLEQLRRTGMGYGAYLLTIGRRSPVGRKAVVVHGLLPWIVWLAGRFPKRLVGLHPRPFPLLRAEVRGAMDAVRGFMAGDLRPAARPEADLPVFGSAPGR
jgi:GT2 family glycosyltransferase